MDAANERWRRLERALLYLILPCSVGARPAQEIAAAAIAGGVDVVQLRDKRASDSQVVASARALRALSGSALVIVNDRPDLARAAGADGVHLGQDDLAVDEARRIVGPGALVGISTHLPAQIAAAGASEADYLGVGPVYETPTKPGVEAVGLELVRCAAAIAAKPFFAIGGIDAARAPEVAAAGARRIAVVRAICDAEDPEAAARGLRTAVEARAGAAVE